MSLAGVPFHAKHQDRFLARRWRDICSAMWRWFDRERELIRLRVTLGMMAEARQRDSQEYWDMQSANQRLHEQVEQLEEEREAWRKAGTPKDGQSSDIGGSPCDRR